MKNFLRKRPGLAHVAREITRYKRLGRSWARIAEILNLQGDGERELKARIPIAYCIPEVVEAIETKQISVKRARKFGGAAWDGSGALGREEQIALLAEMLTKKRARGEAGATASIKAIVVEAGTVSD